MHRGPAEPVLFEDLRPPPRPHRHPGRSPQRQIPGHRIQSRRGKLGGDQEPRRSGQGETAQTLRGAADICKRADGIEGRESVLPHRPGRASIIRNGRQSAGIQRPGL